jgi:hypothetical protein
VFWLQVLTGTVQKLTPIVWAADPGRLEEMQRNGVLECSVCHSKVAVPSPRSVSRAYDKHRSKISSKYRALNVLLVSGDCILVGLQVVHSP